MCYLCTYVFTFPLLFVYSSNKSHLINDLFVYVYISLLLVFYLCTYLFIRLFNYLLIHKWFFWILSRAVNYLHILRLCVKYEGYRASTEGSRTFMHGSVCVTTKLKRHVNILLTSTLFEYADNRSLHTTVDNDLYIKLKWLGYREGHTWMV